MATKPNTFRSSWAGAQRKPFADSRTAKHRLVGRALQARNLRIKERDKYTCKACGRVTEDGEVDHRVSLARGGSEDDSNCQWLCRMPCHADKTARENGQRPKRQIGEDGYPV